MKRLSVVGLSLSMMLGSQMAKASEESSLWDDMLMVAYGAPDEDQGQAAQEQGQAAQEQGNVSDDEDQTQGQAAQEQQEQQEQQGQQEQQAPAKGPAKFNFGGGHGGGHGDHGDGQNSNVSLNPNLASLKYFVGAWDCNATVTDPNGDTHQFTKSVWYKPAFGGNWLGSCWAKNHSFNHDAMGAAAETYNGFTQQFVKVAVGKCGGYGYSTSSGWTGSDITWLGEGWNWGSVEHGYSQVVLSQVSDSEYTVKVAGSLDGSNFTNVGNATCKKSSKH